MPAILEHLFCLDLRTLLKAGPLVPGRTGKVVNNSTGRGVAIDVLDNDRLRLRYRAMPCPGSIEDRQLTITLGYDHNGRNGSRRRWFCCPDCGRHTSKLYYRHEVFTCAQCTDAVREVRATPEPERSRLLLARVENQMRALISTGQVDTLRFRRLVDKQIKLALRYLDQLQAAAQKDLDRLRKQFPQLSTSSHAENIQSAASPSRNPHKHCVRKGKTAA